ncbi:MAG: glycerol-3-phosphate dehydrogenase/oxidase [bacterium]|nr:glycerol-3-phosphate dehydrogenase/oxidase [bacterium]
MAERRLEGLVSETFDLVVVGGGIFGLFVAWDAVLRGLSVALLEKNDFGHAASANCFKVVHGGVRYMQHLDVVRVRESSRERSAWLRIAPHQVSPLPFLMPTYGFWTRGRPILATGMKLYDALTADRNRDLPDPARHIPATRVMSRNDALNAFPALDSRGLSGGVVFHDGQMRSPARLAICTLLAATAKGLQAANYAEVTGFLQSGNRIDGVVARDTLADQVFEVRAKVVVNATGGWADPLLRRTNGTELNPRPTYSRDAYFLVNRCLSDRYALAVPGSTRDPDAVLSRSTRHLFLVPWRGRTLVGVWHRVWTDDPDSTAVSDAELAEFIAEINAGYPELRLRPEDVISRYCGLVLFGDNREGATDLSYGKRSRLIDHAECDGLDGLITLLGVRYTTARLEAARTLDLVSRKLDRSLVAASTEHTPLYGGEIDDFQALRRDAQERFGSRIPAGSLEALLCNHGSAYERVLDRTETESNLPGSETLRAEVVHAVREEMAQRLSDVAFRRTDLATAGDPGAAALNMAAGLMAEELGWETGRLQKELEETRAELGLACAEETT